MADEIRNQNVVRVYQDGDRWHAAIGPDDASGLMGDGPTPQTALLSLAIRAELAGWMFDPSYRPAPGPPTFHDA